MNTIPPFTPTTPVTPGFPGTNGGSLSSVPPVFPPGSLMLDRWRIINKLGQGAFGQTIEAHDLIIDKRVAIKFETGTAAKQVLKLEISILKRLQQCPFTAQFFASGAIDIGQPPAPQTYMVMELLGTNLSDLRKQQPGNKFSPHTTALLGWQMIEALKWVHQSGYLHRDVKPSNFVMGLDKYPDNRGIMRHRCYIIDFGLSRRYMTPEGTVRDPRSTAGFRGTARYASLNAHESKELSRRDDFWSILYLLTEFLVGQLPWRREKDRDAVYKIKRACTSPSLLDGLPGSMTNFYYHLCSLQYSSVPDYDVLQSYMDQMFEQSNVPTNIPYDWECTSSLILNPQPPIVLKLPPKPISKNKSKPKPKAVLPTTEGAVACMITPAKSTGDSHTTATGNAPLHILRTRSPNPNGDPTLRGRQISVIAADYEEGHMDADDEGKVAFPELQYDSHSDNQTGNNVDNQLRPHRRPYTPVPVSPCAPISMNGSTPRPKMGTSSPLIDMMARMRIHGRSTSPPIPPPSSPPPPPLPPPPHTLESTIHQEGHGGPYANSLVTSPSPISSIPPPSPYGPSATTLYRTGHNGTLTKSNQSPVWTSSAVAPISPVPLLHSPTSPSTPPPPTPPPLSNSPHYHHQHHQHHHKVGVLQRIQRGVRGLHERLLTKSPIKSSSNQTVPVATTSSSPLSITQAGNSTSPIITYGTRIRSNEGGNNDNTKKQYNCSNEHKQGRGDTSPIISLGGILDRMHKAHDSKDFMDQPRVIYSVGDDGQSGSVPLSPDSPYWNDKDIDNIDNNCNNNHNNGYSTTSHISQITRVAIPQISSPRSFSHPRKTQQRP